MFILIFFMLLTCEMNDLWRALPNQHLYTLHPKCSFPHIKPAHKKYGVLNIYIGCAPSAVNVRNVQKTAAHTIVLSYVPCKEAIENMHMRFIMQAVYVWKAVAPSVRKRETKGYGSILPHVLTVCTSRVCIVRTAE